MPPPSYRLDTVAARLAERIEGARRTWAGKPADAEREYARIADEMLVVITGEHDELMGATGWSDVLRKEIRGTFLPRYTRLAIAHTELEAAGFGAWRGGDPIARLIATGAALLAALAFARVVHHPLTLLAFVFALFAPVMPEIRAWYHRRAYQRSLQEAVDDMGRIQEELERYEDDVYTDERLKDAQERVEQARQRRNPEKERSP